MQRCTMEEIYNSSNLMPFDQTDIRFLISLVKKQHAKGLIVQFHPWFADTPQEAIEKMAKGIFVLTCPQIESDFLFTCENGGRGLFGGQKKFFRVFIGDMRNDDFTAANTFKMFGLAATSINNIFRNEGLLKGRV